MDKLNYEQIGQVWATSDQASDIACIELESFPDLFGDDEFERRCEVHHKRLLEKLTHYRLLSINNQDGSKAYIGWMSLQWNLSKAITVEWPETVEHMTLGATQIPKQPLIERLRSKHPEILQQDLFYVCGLGIRPSHQDRGLGTKMMGQLKQVANKSGLKILLFAEAHPDERFIAMHEEELALSEKQARDAAEALQNNPSDEAAQQAASFIQATVRVERQLTELVRAAAASPGRYPLTFYTRLGFRELGWSFRWSPNRERHGVLPAPRKLCPMMYEPSM
ncbi:hypothetical protein GGR54DRAFT_644189 [Hypoxylon sp. NC1633]|nr:hypothetical protein GGR54DRAFT_644189 [Hypoxylon sp. NC1633]